MNSNKCAEMQNAIKNYVKRNLPKDKNKAVIGVIHGGRVIINGVSYSYTPAVDMYFGDGDHVACLLPDSSIVAVVVGVL